MIATLQSKVSGWFWAESSVMWVPRIQLIVNIIALPVIAVSVIGAIIGLFIGHMGLLAGSTAVAGVSMSIMLWLDGKVSQKRLSQA